MTGEKEQRGQIWVLMVSSEFQSRVSGIKHEQIEYGHVCVQPHSGGHLNPSAPGKP